MVEEPEYVALYRSGELEHRALKLEARLVSCDICPRACRVNRLKGELGFCHSAYQPIVASFCAHHGEEPVLSGSRGSGTIFFGNCNLRCVYCQNYQISQDWQHQGANEVDCHRLAEIMLKLQAVGCHNINLVSPSHFVPQILLALVEAVPLGLRLPIVYNSNSYDSMETLVELNGIVDIYLPDLKYASDTIAKELSDAVNYVCHARSSIREMYHQVGELMVDVSGVAKQGVMVRHLILPNGLAGSRQSLSWLAGEVSTNVSVSLMSQYHPTHRAHQYPLLLRRILLSEYEDVLETMNQLGLASGWSQGMASHRLYLPDFEQHDHPFVVEH